MIAITNEERAARREELKERKRARKESFKDKQEGSDNG